MVGAWLWRNLQRSVNVWDCTLGPSPAVYTWDGRRCGEQVTNKNVLKHYHHPSDVKGQVLVCSADNERIIFVFHRACHYTDRHYFFTKLTASQNYTSQERISSSSFILQYFCFIPSIFHSSSSFHIITFFSKPKPIRLPIPPTRQHFSKRLHTNQSILS
jgi:hypothetical protein